MTVQAIFDTLAADAELSALGITGDRIFEAHSIDERPVHSGPFMVLKWEESTLYTQTYTGMQNGIPRAPRVLTIWVHIPWDETRQFDLIDTILNRVDLILDAMEHVEGADGYTVTLASKSGRSGNLSDEGFKTITRNAVFGVLYRLETQPV
jgi:hypothetical protein